MVVDRTDLDAQTQDEFTKFASEFHTGQTSGTAKSNTLIVGIKNQRQLTRSLLSKKKNNTILVTTIQKLSAAMRSAKAESESDFVVSIEKGSKNHVEVVKDLKDPSDTHKYSYSNVIIAVQKRLGKKSIKIDYSKGFNSYVLKLIIDFYYIKSDSMYAYKHQIGKNEQYSYSELFVEFIVNEIQKNPTKFVESLKEGK